MSLQDTFLQAADLAKEADEISARQAERDGKLSANIDALRDKASKESESDRKRLAEIEADIAKLVGPAVGGNGRSRKRAPKSAANRVTADHDAVYKALKAEGEANAKTIADKIGDDTVPVSNALSDLNAQGRVAASGRGRFPKYKAL